MFDWLYTLGASAAAKLGYGKKQVITAANTDAEVLLEVRKLIAETMGLKLNDVGPDSHLVNDLEVDSLDTVELVMDLEDRFGITLPDEETETLTTVRQVANLVFQKRNACPKGA